MPEACRDGRDQVFDCCAICNVAAEGSRVDLVLANKVACDAFCLVLALRVHDGDVHAFTCKRVADALPEPAIPARDQCDFASDIHCAVPRYAAQACALVCAKSRRGPGFQPRLTT